MKILKVLAIGFGGFVALVCIAGGVFYVGWLMPPSQDAVCDNAVPLLMQANQAKLEELPESVRSEAAKTAEEEVRKACTRATKVPQFGRLPYVARMKCMKRATTVDELQACDELPSSY